MAREELVYDLERIGQSSRLITLIELNAPARRLKSLIAECNAILDQFREETHDLPLSPFKGNRHDGVRRRRLDYASARAILELAYERVFGGRRRLSS